MQNRFKISALAVAAAMTIAGVVAACSKDSTATMPQSTRYVAQLSTANEVPPVLGGANGTATFTLTGKTLTYTVMVTGLSSNAVASHIHLGDATTNGGIVYPFTAANVQSGQVASGTIDLTQSFTLPNNITVSGDSILTLLNNGLLYTNVHTANNAGGEIRGQIMRVQSSTGY